MWHEAALMVCAYLVGSFPLLWIMARMRRVPLHKEEDFHIALWHRVGRPQGAMGIIGDFAKGVAVVFVSRALGFDLVWVALAGLAAVVGQMWPVFLRFDGEKGNSIGLATAGSLAPWALFISLVPIAFGAAVRTIPRLRDRSKSADERLKFGGPPSNSLPLAMLVGFSVLPLVAWGLGYPPQIYLVFVGFLFAILLRRLTANVRRDLRVAERKREVFINRALYDRSFL